MIITKQRMAGYTPLRQRTTAPATGTTSPPTRPVAAPAEPIAPVTPVVATEAVVEKPVPQQPPAAAAPVTTHKQRMAGYTPLRLRDLSQAPVIATPTQVVADPAPTAMEQPAPVATPTPVVASSTPPSTTPTPKNRMKGYTPLRLRTGAEPIAVETPVATVVEQPVEQPAPAEPTVLITTPAKTRQEHPVQPPATKDIREPSRWRRPLMFIGGMVILALAVVLTARGLRSLESVQAFITTYNGHSTMPDSAPTGMPWWMGWQHFLNMFFIVLIIRTGLQIRHEKRPEAMWTPKAGSFYSPKNSTPKKVSITTWLHQTLDALWILNGLAFIILLSVTGHWMRVVPTNWDIFPNIASVALQYASLDWPTENGWIHYNALQMVSYFLVIYVAAPLAVLTGLRMSSWWPSNATTLNKIYPVELARTLHFPVMLFFVFFVIAHVFLVLSTGALQNLNHMYTSRDVADFWGLVIFLISVAITAAGWVLLRPTVVIPLASKVGTVSKN